MSDIRRFHIREMNYESRDKIKNNFEEYKIRLSDFIKDSFLYIKGEKEVIDYFSLDGDWVDKVEVIYKDDLINIYKKYKQTHLKPRDILMKGQLSESPLKDFNILFAYGNVEYGNSEKMRFTDEFYYDFREGKSLFSIVEFKDDDDSRIKRYFSGRSISYVGVKESQDLTLEKFLGDDTFKKIKELNESPSPVLKKTFWNRIVG